jgi:transposase InsO family protein
MVQVIDDPRGAHGVEPICNLLPIAPATCDDPLARRADPARLSDRAQRDAELRPQIQRVFDANWQVYGVRKIWRQLRREGFDLARCTAARLMKAMNIQGVIRGKPQRTTIPDKKLPCPLDKVNRPFRVPAPNMLWGEPLSAIGRRTMASDVTCVATWTGFVYVAFVIDAYARKIVGWRASTSPMRGSFWRPSNRPSMNAARSRAWGWSIIRTADHNTCRSNTPKGWQARASSPRLAASVTGMTRPWQRRSMTSSRPKSSIVAALGAPSKPSNTQRWNGGTGSTIAVCSSP